MLTSDTQTIGHNMLSRHKDALKGRAWTANKSPRIAFAFFGVACLLFGTGQTGNGQTLMTHRLPAVLAMEAVEAAVTACAQQGYSVTATVVDADAQRTAVLRGDTAGVHTFEASWSKAYTAVAFAPMANLDSSGEVATRLAQFTARQPPGTLPFQPPTGMIFRAGGLTIKLGEEVIGAIGVGGSPSAEGDELCARAGLDKIHERIR
jgi:uncharacterized protein GlcG (DUF336 family)